MNQVKATIRRRLLLLWTLVLPNVGYEKISLRRAHSNGKAFDTAMTLSSF